ncbi:MAG: YggS family pyridoxal phosphate-dependent enzyme [Pseudomonadota bacterium]
MNDSPNYGSLATRLAALQQTLAVPREGGIAPYAAQPLTPSATRLARSATHGPLDRSEHQAFLIGASKGQPEAVLAEAIRLGLSDFGENKVQEAQAKWPALKAAHPAVRLHLIGPLQSNKAREAVALFDVIQTIDREKIADALADAIAKEGRTPAMLIQVNTGEEPQKAGVTPRATAALLAHCRGLGLPVVGLMCVPPEGVNPAPHFALLRKMAETLGLPEVSMGMSGDYETALRLGATMVRVGTALFGARA